MPTSIYQHWSIIFSQETLIPKYLWKMFNQWCPCLWLLDIRNTHSSENRLLETMINSSLHSPAFKTRHPELSLSKILFVIDLLRESLYKIHFNLAYLYNNLPHSEFGCSSLSFDRIQEILQPFCLHVDWKWKRPEMW